jgi:hypothetical protein
VKQVAPKTTSEYLEFASMLTQELMERGAFEKDDE